MTAPDPTVGGHVWRAVGPNAAELWNRCVNCRADEGSVEGRLPCRRPASPPAVAASTGTSEDVATPNVIQRIVNAWDCCGTCARGVLARHVADREAAARAEALREAAAWVADGIGYPIQVQMPDHPMPSTLWGALVDHVHADKSGKWHGNTLDREDTESWLADEAGRADS